MSDCIFCQIIAGQIPAKKAGESDNVLAFYDIAPKAPVHILVIPKQHLSSAADAGDDRGEAVLGQVMRFAVNLAAELGLPERGGYRLVTNIGPDGGQTVDHLHLHLLGGRTMHWPPG